MSNVGVVLDLAVHDIDLIRWCHHGVGHRGCIRNSPARLPSAMDIALLQFRTVLRRARHPQPMAKPSRRANGQPSRRATK